MKESAYNFLVKHTEKPDKYILFNGLTKALIMLEPDEIDDVKRILAEPNNEDLDQEYRDLLIKNEYIISDQRNELKVIKYRYLNLVFNKNELSLTVIPTLQCNFNCVYCYQRHTRKVYKEQKWEEKFSTEIKDRIYKLIFKKIKGGVKYVRITWYGGEPTLSIDEIIHMTQVIGKMCEEKDVEFKVNMASNGYLLTEDKIQGLTPYLESVTITIDGPPAVHDQRRKYYGESSYDTILTNISKMKEIDPNIFVNFRVTVDKDNVATIPDLLDDIKARGLESVNFRFRSLYADPDKTPELFKKIYSDEEMAKLIPELLREVHQRGILGGFSPTPSTFMRCNAPSRNSLVIMPDGYIHKCWADIESKECIVGELDEDGVEQFNDKIMEWFTYSPLDKPECVECKFLPICMGECCYNDVVANIKEDYIPRSNAGCSLFKYNFDEFLSFYALLVDKNS